MKIFKTNFVMKMTERLSAFLLLVLVITIMFIVSMYYIISNDIPFDEQYSNLS